MKYLINPKIQQPTVGGCTILCINLCGAQCTTQCYLQGCCPQGGRVPKVIGTERAKK